MGRGAKTSQKQKAIEPELVEAQPSHQLPATSLPPGARLPAPPIQGSKKDRDLRSMLASLDVTGVSCLRSIMKDKTLKPSDRIRAVETAWKYRHGKPKPRDVTISPEEEREIRRQELAAIMDAAKSAAVDENGDPLEVKERTDVIVIGGDKMSYLTAMRRARGEK